jgi:hypothetical protein
MVKSTNLRAARPALRDEAGGHFSPGSGPPARWRAGLVMPDSTKMNQDWRYIISKRIFKSRRTPGPDVAYNAQAVLPGLINNIEIAIFTKEVTPGQAGRAHF